MWARSSLLLLPALLRSCIAYTALSDASLSSLPSPGNDFDIHDGAILSPILVPRVPGTPGSHAVLEHLVNFFRDNLPDWKISFQNSSSVTPTSDGKEVPFRNIIATRDPPWVHNEGEVGRLALVAHYDSKLTPEGFIGAIDSAAPCAMILHAARSIDKALTNKWAAMDAQGDSDLDFESYRGVQVLLLDGEEAFAAWTDTDSIYGARAMAEEWEQTFYPAMSTYSNPLDSLDLFLLLDLLGSKDPQVPSFFKTTHWAYQHMADLEVRLRGLDMFKSSPNHPSKRSAQLVAGAVERANEPYFLPEAGKKETDMWLGGMIGDDHVPFMARGVEVLHIIPTPFPSVWHRIEDDGEHLDMDTVEDWALLTAAFAAEWMDLEGFLEKPKAKSADKRDEDAVKDELTIAQQREMIELGSLELLKNRCKCAASWIQALFDSAPFVVMSPAHERMQRFVSDAAIIPARQTAAAQTASGQGRSESEKLGVYLRQSFLSYKLMADLNQAAYNVQDLQDAIDELQENNELLNSIIDALHERIDRLEERLSRHEPAVAVPVRCDICWIAFPTAAVQRTHMAHHRYEINESRRRNGLRLYDPPPPIPPPPVAANQNGVVAPPTTREASTKTASKVAKGLVRAARKTSTKSVALGSKSNKTAKTPNRRRRGRSSAGNTTPRTATRPQRSKAATRRSTVVKQGN